MHHATSGNLSRRGVSEIDTHAVKEYLALPTRGRFAYGLYRDPAILFSVGAYCFFLLKHRLPFGLPLAWREVWRSIVATNILIAAAVSAGAATVGTWLFYIQHQFEGAYWETEKRWSFRDAAVKCSSFCALPKVL